MQINGPANIHGAQPISAPRSTQPADATAGAGGVQGSDEVSISQEAELLSRIQDVPDIRQERVDEIRTQIASGAYETDEKLDVAVSRLLDEIA